MRRQGKNGLPMFLLPDLKGGGNAAVLGGKRVSQIFGVRLGTGMILIIDIAFPADKLDK